DSFPGEDDSGKPGHQGAVEIEEGADLGTGRAGGDLGHRAGQPHVTGWLRCLGVGHDSAPGSNDAATQRGAGSPASANTSSNPWTRHAPNSFSSRTAARS